MKICKLTKYFTIGIALTVALLAAPPCYGADELVVTENGNVGIGTTTPSSLLEVNGTATVGGHVKLSNANPYLKVDGDDKHLVLSGGSGWADTGSTLVLRGKNCSYNPHGIDIWTGNSASVHLLSNGFVGIGTGTPSGKLDVQGDIRAGNSDIYFTKTDHAHTAIGNTPGYAAIENAANYDALMILGRAGTSKGRNVRLWDYLQVNGGMDITGNVGIHTSTPQCPLDVNGNLRYKAGGNTVQMTGTPGFLQYLIDGNYWGVSIWASSRRFKEEIMDLDISSEKIHALNPVSFKWIEERGGKKDFGLIAEEVAEIIPELAAYDGEGKPFSVRYELLSVLLLKELKNQKKINERLTGQLTDFESRMKRLEKAIAGTGVH